MEDNFTFWTWFATACMVLAVLWSGVYLDAATYAEAVDRVARRAKN